MSDSLPPRRSTPPYGSSVPAPARSAGLDGSVGAIPSQEAPPRDSGVLEQQLIEQGGWRELIDLLLNRTEKVRGAERIETFRQIAAIFELQIDDVPAAFAVLDLAHREDPANQEIYETLMRLAAALGRPGDLEAVARRALE